ncbi:hypothetical protein K3179_10210 [Qipengyuania sp. GH38]|uniref:hypothetical protein n=1 Tax=Qipengyuania intermedia TaxID=2867244 RepID=UPI001C87BE70|nr:hypothetical protein [Qipengyuania intermedia]MBX7514914.1 hypothetical protein [Qipengyuania intermedia]
MAELIRKLAAVGAQAATIANLDALRGLYNTSKHDPDKELRLGEALEVVRRTVSALQDISGLGIAAVDAPFQPDLECMVYVGFWDHYVGGETEVGLFLPSDHWMGTNPISTFHIPLLKWDELKTQLVANPRFRRGKDALGEQLWASFSKEGDFLDAGVWQGDIRELLTLLSLHNDRNLEESVIPFLARQNNFRSVGIGLIAACIDVVRSSPDLEGAAFRSAVEERADSEYAVKPGTTIGNGMLDQLTLIIERVPTSQRASLAGPIFRVREATDDKPYPVTLEGSNIALGVG